MVWLLSQLEVQFIITGTNHHSEKEFCSYLQYLEYLSQNRPPPNAYELFAKGYEDYLQSPLQVGLQYLERREVGSLASRCPKILPKLRRQWEGFGILVHCPCQKLANLNFACFLLSATDGQPGISDI